MDGDSSREGRQLRGWQGGDTACLVDSEMPLITAVPPPWGSPGSFIHS